MNRFRRHALPWCFESELEDAKRGNRENTYEDRPHGRHRKAWK